MNPKVDWFFNKASKWQKEFEVLRTIILDCDLIEELKWGQPCYMYEDRNIVLIHGFKEYCALLFFKGALLKDKKKILVQQTENVQAARQIRFTNISQIEKLEKTLKAYIYEALEAEVAGRKVAFKKVKDFALADEFKKELDKSKALRTAFHALTPGRQRGYLLHFSDAKQSKTREARVKKCLKRILEGKGLENWAR